MRSLIFGMATALALAGAPALAATATDPVNDYLTSYTGAHAADLDIVSASASFDGTNYILSAMMNGTIVPTPGLLYVWGVNRGAGTARLNLNTPALNPNPNTLFDALAVQSTDGTLRIVSIPQVGPPVVTTVASGVSFNGSTVSTSVPLSLWPGTGFNPGSYSFQLWSRLRLDPAADGFNSEIADFGPALFASVPEPATWSMLILGFGGIGIAARRRRHVAYA